jgi:LPS export ABC transporter protein LptC
MNKNTALNILFFSCMLFFCFCSRQPGPPVNSTISDSVPLQEFNGNTSLTMTDSGKIEWILKTTSMRKELTGGVVKITPVELEYFARGNAPISHLTAEKGEVKGKSFESFYVEGNVFVTSTKGFRLKADNLQWDKNRNKITTPGKVRFTTRQGDVLTGRGFNSDPDLDNWEILNDVKGEFKQFEKSMDKGGL